MAEIELKPCPFCGGEAVYSTDLANIHQAPHYIFCYTCDVQTDYYVKQEYAAKSWNRRVTDHQLAQSQAKVEKLKAGMERLASSEAFTSECAISDELRQRMRFAGSLLYGMEQAALAPDARTAGEAGKVFCAALSWKGNNLVIGRLPRAAAWIARYAYDGKWRAFFFGGHSDLFDTREEAVAAAEAAVLALAGAGE